MTCERQIAVDETTKSYFKCAESRVSERLNIDEKRVLAEIQKFQEYSTFSTIFGFVIRLEDLFEKSRNSDKMSSKSARNSMNNIEK